MSVVYTYSTLTDSLQSWHEEDNPDYVAAIPEIIGKAELRCLRELNLTIFDTVTQTNLVIGDRELAKPDGWYVTRDLWVIASTTKALLELKTLSWCNDYAPNTALQATPEYFAELSDENWYVVPTPSAVLTVEQHCGVRPEGLSGTNDESWLGNNVGDLLHNAAMYEAAVYLKKWAQTAAREADYQKTLGIARLELRELIRSSYSPIKSAAVRI